MMRYRDLRQYFWICKIEQFVSIGIAQASAELAQLPLNEANIVLQKEIDMASAT